MSNYAIEVKNLSKKYQLGELENYYTFRDTLANIVKAPFRKLLSNNRKSRSSQLTPSTSSLTPEFIWALKDVSFQVNHGEVLGIIGRNGAGKSTLLKLLSRITAPTEGTIKINGRIGSLLEVGTGFHPELTGRENIFLNGSILGMSKREIYKKFDEIVDFADIEKFIDTPVKRYSSGMYVRLAFAVAAHLDTEILVVDEVLAVGDQIFQNRCLGKMNEFSNQGRTVLFVSHNLSSITKLCNSCLMLESGQLEESGITKNVIEYYRNYVNSFNNAEGSLIQEKISNKNISLLDIELSPNPVAVLDELKVRIMYISNNELQHNEFSVFICFTDSYDYYYCTVFSRDESIFYKFLENKLDITCTLPFHTFLPGKYKLEVGLISKYGGIELWIKTDKEILVVPELFNGSSFDNRSGYSTSRGNWSRN